MKLPNEKLAQILIENSYIDESDLSGFPQSGEGSLLEYLIHKGIVNRQLVAKAIAEHYSLPFIDLEAVSPPRSLQLEIPEEIAKRFRILFLDQNEEKVVIATDDPDKARELPDSTSFIKKRKIELRYADHDSVENFLKNYQNDLGSRLSKIIESEEITAPKLVEEILTDSIALKASDIHFEPEEDQVVIRFRIDGQLEDIATLPHEKYEAVLNKIKVEAKLRIDQHDTPLDGAVRYQVDDGSIDLRISIIPTVTGEKIAIRILKRYVGSLKLETLGASVPNVSMIEKAIKNPHGMIVVTGPTGSGKTTTLYAILKKLNQRDVNITTIEDPVEYRIKGINQIQVNNETDLTFAKGLRSIVRQDPDIILLGEIRDLDTAEIAINSALTGHLLLTTFHANNASSAIPRLIDMGIEPFLLASTLEIIIAQRLVRKLCEGCRYSKSVTKEYLKSHIENYEKYFGSSEPTLYFSKGCDACNYTGFKGRVAIFEIIEVEKEMKMLINKKPTADMIHEIAVKKGMKSIFEDGIDKVKSGVTTFEEVKRVAHPE